MTDEKVGGSAKELAFKASIDLAKQGYEDGAQPLVRNVGQLLALPFRLLNAGLANVYALLTDHEARQRALEKGMTERWAKIPAERLVAPPPNVAGPLLLSYAFIAGSDEDAPLRELYEQLLASAMDSAAQSSVHPAFVEMLRQMTATEARVIRALAYANEPRLPLMLKEIFAARQPHSPELNLGSIIGVQHGFPEGVFAPTDNPEACLLNLQRLGLVEMTFERGFPDESVYEPLRAAAMAELLTMVSEGETPSVQRGQVFVTKLGKQFVSACIGPT